MIFKIELEKKKCRKKAKEKEKRNCFNKWLSKNVQMQRSDVRKKKNGQNAAYHEQDYMQTSS